MKDTTSSTDNISSDKPLAKELIKAEKKPQEPPKQPKETKNSEESSPDLSVGEPEKFMPRSLNLANELRVPNLLGTRSLYTVFLAHTFSFTTVGYQKAYREISVL
jgi:hypothetical protein